MPEIRGRKVAVRRDGTVTVDGTDVGSIVVNDGKYGRQWPLVTRPGEGKTAWRRSWLFDHAVDLYEKRKSEKSC